MRYTAEALLTQLGYTINESVLAQMQRIIKNTKGFDVIEKHIVQLNDALKPFQAYIAMSNSVDYLKIKNESDPQSLEKVDEMIHDWSKKYKIDIKKVDGKETYYILGYKS
ncbi:MAG: hypothetical protein GXO12_00580 [Epsilonproteobacteria bacterium]|nr:hypothetical protein [Campylobacterota bacterium]